MQKIQTFLWFNDQAEEAANLYTSIFKDAKTVNTMPGPGGKPMGVTVELAGSQFILFNGGPQYHPTPAISFFVQCETPEEVQGLWDALSQGGKAMMPLDKYAWSEKYGWVEDKFGVSWQVSLSGKPQSIAPTFMYTGDQQGRCEEAINFYVAQFPSSSIDHIARYEPEEPGPTGQIKHAGFVINGQGFSAMDAHMPSPTPFTPGISMFVNVEAQAEVDQLWDKLGEGGRYDRCGWLQDKFGVSWQIVPTALGRLLRDKDRKKAGQVMQAMLKMNKLDIAGLQKAYDEA
jgi:predicted 3-demethylubiquinone-9 3-methyltransferase (glyoxalase superfamily)